MPKSEKEQIAEFERVFEEASKGEAKGVEVAELEEYHKFRTPLGDKVISLWSEASRERENSIEQRWLKDLRQFRGEYDPEVLKRIHPKRSKAFLSLTRTKVKTLSARQTDLLFPANGDKNWGITPSPIPELNPEIIQNIMFQYQEQTKQVPTEELIRKFINQEARKRCDAMEKEIADQLSELKYRAIIRAVILSGNLYGTGILKGPLVKRKKTKRWLPHGNDWVTVEIENILPYCEFVPVWDVYPDMTARNPDDMRYIFQRYVMTRAKVFELSKRSDFNKEAIIAYLKAHPDGDAGYHNHENELRALNYYGSASGNYKETTVAGTSYIGPGGGTGLAREGKYEVREMWGYMSSRDLIDFGIEIDEDQVGLEVAVNIWMIGDIVIKAMLSPIEGVVFPYHFYYYDKDDTSIWGEGIPTVMRHPQKLFNAGVRAMLDNAAIAAGPIIEANVDLLDMDEDPRDVYPFRVYLREGQGMEATAEAIRVHYMQPYTNEYMALIQFFMSAADEVTAIPRYLYGETNKIGGAGRTATGLSMLMGAANIALKDQIKNFDDGITVPFIKAMYFWNMDFSLKEYIKGDFNVVAKGSTSLIAREVQAESLSQFLNITNNEIDQMYLKRDSALRAMVKIMDLDDFDLIKDANTVLLEENARKQAMAEERDFEKQLAMIKAQSGGHMAQSPAAMTGQRPSMERLPGTALERGNIPEVT